jgi:hypothetical protein
MISEAERLSINMLRRVQVMAEYVIEQQNHEYKIDFEEYWAAHWPGKAQGQETLEFFASDRVWSDMIIMRKVKL